MKIKKITWLAVTGLLFSLTGCSTITGVGKDNTPAPSALASYQAQLSPKLMWTSNAGKGTGDNYIRFNLAADNNVLFTADHKGHVIAVKANSGKQVWMTDLDTSLVAGPAAGNGVVLVGGNNADLYALAENSGKVLWHRVLSNNVVATPAISNSTAIVKTIDGQLWSVALSDGAVQWNYNHGSPQMLLAGGSKPIIIGNKVIVAHADGKLSAYSAVQGKLIWETQISAPSGASDVEQMVDIVADPQLQGNVIYTVSYQGNLAAVDSSTGNILWQQPLSSFTGMTISTQTIFVTDAKSDVWAYNRNNGNLVWQQTYLRYRQLTAPAVIGNYLVVADGQGYVHWLNQQTGKTVARTQISGKPTVLTSPVVIGNNIYILSSEGDLVRYSN